MDNYKELKLSEHFIKRCAERAPWLVNAKKKKDGGGFELDLDRFCYAIKTAKEVERPNTISRLLKYGHKTKYYHHNKAALRHQVIFVVENNLLITLYLYKHSWMHKEK